MPWSFTDQVLTPIAMLDALGIDAFSGRDRRGVGERGWWEGWVVNTLVAKYRGVASGRMGAGMNGKTEAAGCQTIFSMANHDCEPGVQWELADKMRFRVLPPQSSRASVSDGEDDKLKEGLGNGARSIRREVVIGKGEEVKQCYCDRRMDVGQRREWMVGVLGGLCKCARCVREAGELTSEA